jgi:acetyl-CoA carboxylase carboxyltransferase component
MSSQSGSATNHWLHNIIEEFGETEGEIKLGGGQKRIEKQHSKGKLTARERIEKLTDEDARFY